ncbi:helix-turn-helix domain-containing protein [Thermodesulfobacteriota bacterium]
MKKRPSVLGPKEFLDDIKERFFTEKRHSEIPESRILSPENESIKQAVCDFYDVKEEDLLQSRRGVFNEPRNVAIYLNRVLGGESFAEICEYYHLKKHSSAGSVIERVKNQLLKDRKFKKRIDQLSRSIIKS